MDKKEQRKTVWTFALASFLNDFGSDIIYPIWPLFVTAVLGANMAILGFIDGLGEAIVSISQAVSGYFSDKIRKRKIFIWTGYFLGSLSRVGYSLSGTWRHLIPFRILDRAGKIRGAPRDAIIADISSQKNRGRNFGLLRTMDSLGAVFGVIFCIIFFKLLGYRKLFLIASVPSVIGAFLIFFLIKEKKPRNIIYRGLTLKELDKNFKLFLLLSSFFALGSFSYSFLLIYASHFGFRIGFVPVLYLLFTAVASLFSLPAGRLSDKIGRKSVMGLSYLLWGMVSLLSIFIQSYWVIILAFVLYGLHKGSLETVQRAFVSELAPDNFRASALGGFRMITGLCALPASLIAGLLWDKLGPTAPFYFSFSLTILSIIILSFVKEKRSGA